MGWTLAPDAKVYTFDPSKGGVISVSENASTFKLKKGHLLFGTKFIGKGVDVFYVNDQKQLVYIHRRQWGEVQEKSLIMARDGAGLQVCVFLRSGGRLFARIHETGNNVEMSCPPCFTTINLIGGYDDGGLPPTEAFASDR